MITRTSKFASGVAVLAAGAAATLALGQGVANAGTADGSVVAGALSSSAGNASMGPATFKFAGASTTTGSLTTTSSDARGGGALSLGWDLTVAASTFTYAGDHLSAYPAGALDLSAARFSATFGGQPVKTQGNGPAAETDPPLTGLNDGAIGSLDSARTTQIATAGTGNGTYTQLLNLELVVPAEAPVGTYTSTVTTTMAPR